MGAMGAGVDRSSLVTRDPEQGCAALERAYRRLHLGRLTAEDFDLRLATVQAGPVGVQKVRLAGLSGTGVNDGTGLIRIGHLAHGRFTVRAGAKEVAGAAAFLFPSRPYAGRWEDPELATVTVEEAVVLGHARALLGREDFHLTFTGHCPVSPAMGTYWARTARHLAHEALPNDDIMASPILAGELVRTVTTALLHTFPSTFLDQPSPAPPEPAHPAAVRRAVAFIDAHLDTDIGLAEIAAAARLSPRGLQAAFRRHLGITPLHCLRAARMDAARADLLAADPAVTTVATVAARWGFAHPGRFATAYRQVHGEPPAATLHR
ncbi:AraC family transcriptional regulator [Kocuria sp. U4B]